jgi:hypothetical protein
VARLMVLKDPLEMRAGLAAQLAQLEARPMPDDPIAARAQGLTTTFVRQVIEALDAQMRDDLEAANAAIAAANATRAAIETLAFTVIFVDAPTVVH